MKPRSIAVLGLLLLLGAATWAQVPASRPWKPEKPRGRPATPAAPQAPRAGKSGGPVGDYGGVRDTGQFLQDTVEIGRIDDRIFRVREFRDRWKAAYPLDRPKSDSAGRAEFLNSMVNKEVLAALARRLNVPLTFEDRQSLREVTQRARSNAAFQRLVADSVQVTPEEVSHLYEQGRFEFHLQGIEADDRRTAEQARAEILAGRMAWAAAVKKYSTGRGDKGADGDLGWVARLALPPAIAQEIFDLADGQLSGVFQSEDGWRFVRVLERRPALQPAFHALSHLLEQEVRGLKLARRAEQVREGVRRSIGFAFDSANIDWAVARFAEANPPMQVEPGVVPIDLGRDAPDFPPADTARVLARWNGGSYSLGDFVVDFTNLPFGLRPKVEDPRTFRETLDGYVLEPFMARLAEERGIGEDPIVIHEVRKKEEQIRVEHLFADSVQARTRVTPEERKEYYDAHPQDYFTWQTVGYAAIVRHSKAGADSLVLRLKRGESAAAVLRADSLAGFVSGSLKTTREDDRESVWKQLAEEMRPGDVEVTGPDERGDYLVLQKLTHDHGHRLGLGEVVQLVDDDLQNIAAERLLKQFIGRHRARHEVVLHPELLMRIDL
jgi:hypothetical protein